MDAAVLDRLRTQQPVPVIHGRIRRLVAVAAGAGLGIAVLVAGVAVLPGGGRPHGAPGPSATTTAPTRVTEPAPFTYEGTVLTTEAGRWSVGEPGDVVAVGDWRCDGRPAPALLRPATGDVFRFDAWADGGADLTAPALTRVAGGNAVRAADVDGDGCPELVVDRAGGPPVALRAARDRS